MTLGASNASWGGHMFGRYWAQGQDDQLLGTAAAVQCGESGAGRHPGPGLDARREVTARSTAKLVPTTTARLFYAPQLQPLVRGTNLIQKTKQNKNTPRVLRRWVPAFDDNIHSTVGQARVTWGRRGRGGGEREPPRSRKGVFPGYFNLFQFISLRFIGFLLVCRWVPFFEPSRYPYPPSLR